MKHLDTPLPQAAAAATVAATGDTPRLDIYAGIHKALRAFLQDTLLRAGRVDVHDEAEVAALATQTQELLFLMRQHLEHENHFVHVAIERRQPGAANRTRADHLEHEQAIEALEADVATLRCRTGAGRQIAADRLYRHLGLFVAENLQHMHVEETANNQALWAAYTDAELTALHDAIVASLTDRERQISLPWMLRALNPRELAEVVGGMRAGMPAPVFEQMLPVFRGLLEAPAWAKLARSLGLPQ